MKSTARSVSSSKRTQTAVASSVAGSSCASVWAFFLLLSASSRWIKDSFPIKLFWLSLYYVVLKVLSHLLTVPAKFSAFWSCGIRALLRWPTEAHCCQWSACRASQLAGAPGKDNYVPFTNTEFLDWTTCHSFSKSLLLKIRYQFGQRIFFCCCLKWKGKHL